MAANVTTGGVAGLSDALTDPHVVARITLDLTAAIHRAVRREGGRRL